MALAADRDQVKPLAPSSYLTRSDEEAHHDQQKPIQRKYVLCCGCFTAVLLIIAVVLLVLAFTIFHVKSPKVRMDSVSIRDLELENGSIRTDVNVTVVASVSVKNPNSASFKYRDAITTVYYGGVAVGEGWSPGGKAKAMRTVRVNVTVDIVPQKILAVHGLTSDVGSGRLNFSSYTRISGWVKILVKKEVIVEMNCTMRYNISSGSVEDEDCKGRVDL